VRNRKQKGQRIPHPEKSTKSNRYWFDFVFILRLGECWVLANCERVRFGLKQSFLRLKTNFWVIDSHSVIDAVPLPVTVTGMRTVCGLQKTS
jgi:hypothetical protein